MAVSSSDDLRTGIIKQVVGVGTRVAFSRNVPRPLVQLGLNTLGVAIGPAPGCSLMEGSIDSIAYDFWTPEQLKPGRLLIYSHGGGYTMFSHKTHRTLASRLAVEFEAQAIVYDYRLSPEHRFPAAVDDALAVYQHVLRQGYDPRNIILAGDSAGGGLTFALLLAARDHDLPMPGLAIGISPWVDMTLSGYSFQENPHKDVMLSPDGVRHFREMYLDGGDPKHPYASPLFGDLKGFPPVMLQAAGDEILRDDSVLFAAALRQAGIKVELDVSPGLFHVFEFAWRILPQADEAIIRMGDFVRRHYSD
ncbi:MAG: alpha/beta hydrolase [Spirochaetota bacterium]